MKPDTERMMRAYLKIYEDFAKVWRDIYGAPEELTEEQYTEIRDLFQTAWNDSFLGELLREEVLEEYRGILEREQAEQVAREEAKAGEAMII